MIVGRRSDTSRAWADRLDPSASRWTVAGGQIRCLSALGESSLPIDRSLQNGGHGAIRRNPSLSLGNNISRLSAVPQPTASAQIRLDLGRTHSGYHEWRRHGSTGTGAPPPSSKETAASTVPIKKTEEEEKIKTEEEEKSYVRLIEKTQKDSQAATAPSAPLQEEKSPSLPRRLADGLAYIMSSILSILRATPSVLWFYLTHPSDLRSKLNEWKELAKAEAHHYYMGSKLLWADIRTARHIMARTLRGSTLSRRERKQLIRTATDVFRLVPMSVFVLIPFMEFALPFALKIFPNMLPSTFQDSLKEEEKMKRELQTRISMAGFFQDTLKELAKEQKKVAQKKVDAAIDKDNSTDETRALAQEASAADFLEFLDKARKGEPLPPDVIIQFSQYFSDNLTLDHMDRMQLINLCKYMGLPPYGNDNLLRFQLRHKTRVLKEDDQRILWEGIDSLTKMELREACRERGMRSTGLSKEAYRESLQQWLDLSVQKKVPISLLIMSRTFFLHDEMLYVEENAQTGGTEKKASAEEASTRGLADAMSGIDKDLLNEITLEMASSEEKSKSTDIRRIQLEVLEHQNELIKEEQEERDAAAEKVRDRKAKHAAAEEEDKANKLATAEEADAPVAASGGGEVALDDSTTVFSRDGSIDAREIETAESAAADPVDAGRAEIAEDTVKSEDDGEDDSGDEDDVELSTDEIKAISQLASPDPVQAEREELKRIKEALSETVSSDEQSAAEEGDDDDEGEEIRRQAEEEALEVSASISIDEPLRTEEAQNEAAQALLEIEEAKKDSSRDPSESADGDTGQDSPATVAVGDVKLQKAIDRLSGRVEDMVGKIETQLTDVESKIGDKFHLLDRDGDGVLTMEEMAQVLQTVLKRELTSEEAMAIAEDMDQDKDGFFSVAELAQWCESESVVKLAEEGRDEDLDDLITERVHKRRRLRGDSSGSGSEGSGGGAK